MSMIFINSLRNLMAPAPMAPQPMIAPAGRLGSAPMRLSLALQGGGSFGAFTWGVLDRLLEERGIVFDSVSGSSAGAINAALLAGGLARDGREGARAALERFWRRASGASPSAPLTLALAAASRVFSPYQLNPFDLNPLRALIESDVDSALLRERSPVRLLIGATRVADGRLRVFRESEVSTEVLLASACLPLLHQAVEIEGEAYWDGGYAANPPLLPLVELSGTPEILVVQVIPSRQAGLPRSPGDIQRRLEYLTFNASLVRDLDALETLRKTGAPDRSGTKPGFALHRVAAEDFYADLGEASAGRLDWSFLSDLRDAGRQAASRWLNGESLQPAAEAPSPAAQSASRPLRKVG